MSAPPRIHIGQAWQRWEESGLRSVEVIAVSTALVGATSVAPYDDGAFVTVQGPNRKSTMRARHLRDRYRLVADS